MQTPAVSSTSKSVNRAWDFLASDQGKVMRLALGLLFAFGAVISHFMGYGLGTKIFFGAVGGIFLLSLVVQGIKKCYQVPAKDRPTVTQYIKSLFPCCCEDKSKNAHQKSKAKQAIEDVATSPDVVTGVKTGGATRQTATAGSASMAIAQPVGRTVAPGGAATSPVGTNPSSPDPEQQPAADGLSATRAVPAPGDGGSAAVVQTAPDQTNARPPSPAVSVDGPEKAPGSLTSYQTVSADLVEFDHETGAEVPVMAAGEKGDVDDAAPGGE